MNIGWDTKYTEIVPSERIRPKSTEAPITNRTFITFQLDVPEELQVDTLPNTKRGCESKTTNLNCSGIVTYRLDT